MSGNRSETSSHRRAMAWGGLIMFTGIIITFLFQLFGPDPRIVVSENTTVITAPLRKDGLPDYQKYWRDYGREGVTFQNNAAVPFWQAVWPAELSPKHWPSVSDALGFDRIPSSSGTLEGPTDKAVTDAIGFWLTERYQINLTPEDSDGLLTPSSQATISGHLAGELVDQAMNRPWTSADFPPLGDWVARNEQPLALLHEAATRPKWWSPSPSLLGDEYEGAIMILLPGVQSLRNAARALSIRAMWHAGEGRHEEAWNDIKTIRQLAQFCGQGVTLVEQLVAIAMDGVALKATHALLQRGEFDAQFARQVLLDLNARQLPCDVVKSFDQGERVLFADTVVTQLAGAHSNENLGLGATADFLDYLQTVSFNWNLVLREANRWYDRLVESARLPTRAERAAAYDSIEEDLTQVARSVKDPTRLATSLFSTRARSAIVSDVLISLMLPALDAATKAQDRAEAILDLTRVAAALAVYRAEQGEYPETLEQLVPSVLAEVPLDLYTDKPFHYERMPDGGYLLYSMYENGTDDDGTDFGGEIVGGDWVDGQQQEVYRDASDIVIRAPLPKFAIPEMPDLID